MRALLRQNVYSTLHHFETRSVFRSLDLVTHGEFILIRFPRQEAWQRFKLVLVFSFPDC